MKCFFLPSSQSICISTFLFAFIAIATAGTCAASDENACARNALCEPILDRVLLLLLVDADAEELNAMGGEVANYLDAIGFGCAVCDRDVVIASYVVAGKSSNISLFKAALQKTRQMRGESKDDFNRQVDYLLRCVINSMEHLSLKSIILDYDEIIDGDYGVSDFDLSLLLSAKTDGTIGCSDIFNFASVLLDQKNNQSGVNVAEDNEGDVKSKFIVEVEGILSDRNCNFYQRKFRSLLEGIR